VELQGVLTVLRNRVYLGEVCFRGSWHPAPQPALIDAATFEATQAPSTQTVWNPMSVIAADHIVLGRTSA
jgi:hypothetical protein